MASSARPANRLSASGSASLLVAAAFATGVAAGLGGVSFPLALPALAALTVALARRPWGAKLVAGAMRAALGLLLALPLGYAAVRLDAWRDPARRLLRTWEGHGFEPWVTPVALHGRLLDLELLPDGRIVLVLRLERYRLPGHGAPAGRLSGGPVARLTVADPQGGPHPHWRAGDILEVTARLGAPRSFRNPGAFDYRSFLRARGIGLLGTVKNARLVTLLGRAPTWGPGARARARAAVVRAIGRAAGERDAATAAFLSALLVGERDDLPPELEETLQRSGVYHIVALSGLNVAVIALLASLAGRLVPWAAGGRRMLPAAAIAVYWGLARDGGSIARAALMAILYLAGGVLGRRVGALGSTGLTAVLLLAWRPAWIGDAGFELTYSAVFALILLAPRPADGGPASTRWARAGRAIAAAIRTSAAAFAGTALIAAHHFHRLTPAGLVANLAAIPIANALLLLALGVAGLEPVSAPAAAATLRVAARLLAALVDLCRLSASLPGASFFVLPPPAAVVLAGTALLLLAGAGHGAARRAALVLLGLLFAGCALGGRAGPPPGRFEVTTLDVGQGDAILVRLPEGFTLLVDTGGLGRGSFDMGARVVAPAMRALGCLRLDLLVITHAHRDHLGGARSILGQFRPGALWLGRMPPHDDAVERLEEDAARLGVPVVLPRRGVRLSIGGAVLEVLNPGRGVPESREARNDDSLVLRLSRGRRAVLLTGDLEAPLEAVLLREGCPVAADLLKVGHHGSRTSTTTPFLRRVAPAVAVVSVGEANPWGHPDREVLDRLAAAGARVLRTDRDGAVRFVTDGAAPWGVERLAPPRLNTPRGSSE